MSKQPVDFFLPSLPTNLDLSLRNNCPQGLDAFNDGPFLIERFRAYIHVQKGRELHFTGPDRHTGELREITVSATSSSRYTPAGRNKIRRKLMKRLGTGQVQSVLVTLTVDPKRFTMGEAYEVLWSFFAAFRRALWKYLDKHGRKHSPYYVAVIEQHKSGYPHLHIVYPGLRYLAPKEIINTCWKMGTTHIQGGRKYTQGVMVSAVKYVLKYISKLSGWTEEGLAYLWHARARLYNISPKLYVLPKAPTAPGWTLTAISYTDEALKDLARRIARLRFHHRIRRKEVYRHPDITR